MRRASATFVQTVRALHPAEVWVTAAARPSAGFTSIMGTEMAAAPAGQRTVTVSGDRPTVGKPRSAASTELVGRASFNEEGTV